MAMLKLIQSLLVLDKKERHQLLSFVKLPPYEYESRDLKFKILQALAKKPNDKLLSLSSKAVKALYKLKNKGEEYSEQQIAHYNTELNQVVCDFHYYILTVSDPKEQKEALLPGIREVMLFEFYNERIEKLDADSKTEMRPLFEKILNTCHKNLDKNYDKKKEHSYLFAKFLVANYELSYTDPSKADKRSALIEEMQERLQQCHQLGAYKIKLAQLHLLKPKPEEEEPKQLQELIQEAYDNPPAEDAAAYPYYLCLLLHHEIKAERIKAALNYLEHNETLHESSETTILDLYRGLINSSRHYYIQKKDLESEQLFLKVLQEGEKLGFAQNILQLPTLVSFTIGLLCQSSAPSLRSQAKTYAQKYKLKKKNIISEAMLQFEEGNFEEVLDTLNEVEHAPSYSSSTIRKVLQAMSLYELQDPNKPDDYLFDSLIERIRQHIAYHADRPNPFGAEQAARVQTFIRLLKKIYRIRIDGTLSAEQYQAKIREIKQEVEQEERLPYESWLRHKVQELFD